MVRYEYSAKCTGVYDGDTITVDVDLGFGIFLKHQRMRLLGVDTPELRGPERADGLKARDFVRDLVLEKEVMIRTVKDGKGKYGRWLVEVWVGGVSLNTRLIQEGLATPYPH